MPTYEYECSACGHRFDELQSFTEEPLTKCPKCKKNKLTRLFGGGGAILFKGSGFYETDYRRAGEAKKSEGETSETKSESKTEAKTETKAEATSPPPPPPASDGKSKGGGKKAK